MKVGVRARICLATYVVDTVADVVDPSDGRTSLREAIEASNLSVDEDEIKFADELSGSTLWLTGGELRVVGSLVVAGPGADRQVQVEKRSAEKHVD